MKDELARLNQSLTSLFTNIAFKPDEPQTFDLREVVHDLDFLIRPQARRQTTKLDLVIGDRPVLVTGHRDAFKQAVLNVAMNALEAMKDGGTLQITLANDGSAATLSVRDGGSGIAAAVLPRIYDRGFSVKPNGFGMGLYVTRSIVAQHGGTMHVESTPAGTRVDIRVPTGGVA
jgi:two-component system, sporulation sensor kinase D